MKKIISYLLIISTILFLAGCSNDSNNTNNKSDDLPENIPEELKTELSELKGFYEIDSEGRIKIDGVKLANAKIVGTWQLSEESINKIKEFKKTNPDEYARSNADNIPDQLHFSSDGYGWEYIEEYKDLYEAYNLEGEPIKWVINNYVHYLESDPDFYLKEYNKFENGKITENNEIKFIRPSTDETTNEIDWIKTHSRETGFALTNNLNKLIIKGQIFDTSINYLIYTRQ